MSFVLPWSAEKLFLSTYPVRGTTLFRRFAFVSLYISIHVPRAGYDLFQIIHKITSLSFLSTYPVRGTTVLHQPLFQIIHISIHVPRAGYDGVSG